MLPLDNVKIKFWYVSKSNVKFVPVKTAGTLAFPKTILPVPLGVRFISPLLVLTILFPFTSRLPPSCGLVSPTTSVDESDTFTVFAVVLNVAKVISSVPSKNFNIGAVAVVVSNQNVPLTALAGLDEPEFEVFIAPKQYSNHF